MVYNVLTQFMKSRWTIGVLVLAVIIIWSFVLWRIFAPNLNHQKVVPVLSGTTDCARQESVMDTLRLDYLDPFLKRNAVPAVESGPMESFSSLRKRVELDLVHLGTISSCDRVLYIVRCDEVLYELQRNDIVSGFRLCKVDADSLYFEKDGFVCVVERYNQ